MATPMSGVTFCKRESERRTVSERPEREDDEERGTHPDAGLGVLKLDAEDEDPDERENEARERERQAHFGLTVAVRALRAPPNPQIRPPPGDDLAEDGTSDGSDELDAGLLRVELVFAPEEGRNLDGEEHLRASSSSGSATSSRCARWHSAAEEERDARSCS